MHRFAVLTQEGPSESQASLSGLFGTLRNLLSLICIEGDICILSDTALSKTENIGSTFLFWSYLLDPLHVPGSIIRAGETLSNRDNFVERGRKATNDYMTCPGFARPI